MTKVVQGGDFVEIVFPPTVGTRAAKRSTTSVEGVMGCDDHSGNSIMQDVIMR
ncbi:MAG TPA: hypothetical protein VIX37_05305 [Candidatus Sulfotelmatobacter sp.]